MLRDLTFLLGGGLDHFGHRTGGGQIDPVVSGPPEPPAAVFACWRPGSNCPVLALGWGATEMSTGSLWGPRRQRADP